MVQVRWSCCARNSMPCLWKRRLGFPTPAKFTQRMMQDATSLVMHACGHDVHMASLVATAAIMAHSKDSWQGTLMLIGQPAEETIGGAQGMIDDGLFKRFPKP